MATHILLGSVYKDQNGLPAVAVAEYRYFKKDHLVCLYYANEVIQDICMWVHAVELKLTTTFPPPYDVDRVQQALTRIEGKK